MQTTRRLAMAASLAFAAPFAALPAMAEGFPSRPLTWIVPYPAGGPADVIARNIAPRFARELGQPVVIENLGGVGGALAANKVLAAPADGYTLFQGSPNEAILAALANAAVKIKPEDFTLVTPFTNNPLVLLVRKDFPAATLDEFLALARSSGGGNGKPLNYGSVGAGSMFHLAAEDLGARLNARLLHVPYKGGAPLLQDLGVGSIDFALLPFTSNYVGLADAGRLKILAAAAPQRLPMLKDTPTFDESRSVRDFHHGAWAGLMLRRGTPPAVVQRLHAALAATLADRQVREALTATGSQVHKVLSLPEAEDFLRMEARRYRALAQQVGLKPQ
jgi:tripartite-type tricarboxylate transporter receptor subunit TctC